MKSKLLITTNHPANYMDVLFNGLSSHYNLTILYNKDKSTEKLWKKQDFYPSEIIKDIPILKILSILDNQDFLIIGGWKGKINFSIILYLILRRKRFSVFSDVPDEKNINFFKKFVKKILFYFIPYIFVTGKTGLEHYSKHYNLPSKKLKIFPYSILLPNKEKTLLKNQQLDKELILDKNKKIKIFIANRFINRKGYDVIADAFIKLKMENLLDVFSIKIAGTGEEYQKYKSIFNDLDSKIEILDWIEVDKYNEYIENMDIFIHASNFEPYGIPVLDSMAHGKLTIASTGVMSAVDYIIDAENGFLFEKGNSDELFNILKNISFNREKYIS